MILHEYSDSSERFDKRVPLVLGIYTWVGQEFRPIGPTTPHEAMGFLVELGVRGHYVICVVVVGDRYCWTDYYEDPYDPRPDCLPATDYFGYWSLSLADKEVIDAAIAAYVKEVCHV